MYGLLAFASSFFSPGEEELLVSWRAADVLADAGGKDLNWVSSCRLKDLSPVHKRKP